MNYLADFGFKVYWIELSERNQKMYTCCDIRDHLRCQIVCERQHSVEFPCDELIAKCQMLNANCQMRTDHCKMPNAPLGCSNSFLFSKSYGSVYAPPLAT